MSLGFHMVVLCSSYGFLWFSTCFPVVLFDCSTVFICIPMVFLGFPLAFLWFSFDFPWLSHGFLWSSRGFPWLAVDFFWLSGGFAMVFFGCPMVSLSFPFAILRFFRCSVFVVFCRTPTFSSCFLLFSVVFFFLWFSFALQI